MPNVKPIISKPALDHIKKMEEKYPAEIAEAIKNTHIIRDSAKFREEVEKNKRGSNFSTEQVLLGHSSIQEATCGKLLYRDDVTGLVPPDKKVALLNFASYKHAGGGFLKGSCAQEESLCYSSILYNVLSAFDKDYYAVNRGFLNDSLYTNAALYSENVTFLVPHSDNTYKCDVITCAAPNWKAYKAKGGSYNQNLVVLYDRVKFIKAICTLYHVDVLFAGAWGCGVFEQDPRYVAGAFQKVFTEQMSEVETIYHPIPYYGHNYKEFKDMIFYRYPIYFPFVPRNTKASPSAVTKKDITSRYKNNQRYSDMVKSLTKSLNKLRNDDGSNDPIYLNVRSALQQMNVIPAEMMMTSDEDHFIINIDPYT